MVDRRRNSHTKFGSIISKLNKWRENKIEKRRTLSTETVDSVFDDEDRKELPNSEDDPIVTPPLPTSHPVRNLRSRDRPTESLHMEQQRIERSISAQAHRRQHNKWVTNKLSFYFPK